MVKACLLPLLFLLFIQSSAQVLPYKNPKLPVETRVQDLLSRMTPEEKFWQLFMFPGDIEGKKEKFTQGVFGLQVSIPETMDPAGQIVQRKTDWSAQVFATKINAMQKFFLEESRLGIPIIPFEEALHGLLHPEATVFPQSIGLAASWDTALMGKVARAIAEETRIRGIRMILSPVVNIADDVRWGRTEETYGEDPFLTSLMGTAFVSSFEKQGIVTTPKHFVANSGAGGRDSYPVEWNLRQLEEVYFPPFRACFTKGGSRSVMTSYNSLDGSPCTAHDWLLNTWLKKDQGFKGFVISDACAVGGANVLHYTAADYPESSANAMINGLDVILQTEYDHYTLFIPPFLDGRIPQSRIDEAVSRVLRVKFELGLFENPYVDEQLAGNPGWMGLHSKLAAEAAMKSVVLLKNSRNTLPLAASVKSIAVIGPDATEARFGGYSGTGNEVISILEGIRKRAGEGTQVGYAPGCGRKTEEFVVVPDSCFFTKINDEILNGLNAEYYNTLEQQGLPVVTRVDKRIDFRWTLYAPDPAINFDFFSARWVATLNAPVSGRFKIGIEGNDGYRLYLDGKLILDHTDGQSYGLGLAEVDFVKDRKYDLRIEFSESSGSVWFKLVWNIGVPNNWQQQIRDAVELAKKSDVVILTAGIEEGEGRDRAKLNLPGHQEELIRQVCQTGKPVVVVLVGGSAVKMTDWIEDAAAILDVWYPGEQGGTATAAVLFGDYNPAGRLPVTFPQWEGQLPLVYNHKPTGRNDDYADMTGKPLFPFGYGLSYTRFEYRDLHLAISGKLPDSRVEVRFKVKNSGALDGEEVVQLYVHDELASVARPVKELKGFKRVFLKAGEEKEITMHLHASDQKMLNNHLQWVTEPGDFRIMVGASSADIRLRGIARLE